MNLLGLSYRYLSMLFNLLRYHNNSLRYYNLHWISEKKNILRNRRIVGKRQVFHSSVMLILVAYFVTVQKNLNCKQLSLDVQKQVYQWLILIPAQNKILKSSILEDSTVLSFMQCSQLLQLLHSNLFMATPSLLTSRIPKLQLHFSYIRLTCFLFNCILFICKMVFY